MEPQPLQIQFNTSIDNGENHAGMPPTRCKTFRGHVRGVTVKLLGEYGGLEHFVPAQKVNGW